MTTLLTALFQITEIATTYEEKFTKLDKDSNGWNRASFAGNLPPLENVSVSASNYWFGQRNQSTALGGEFFDESLEIIQSEN